MKNTTWPEALELCRIIKFRAWCGLVRIMHHWYFLAGTVRDPMQASSTLP
jgi:hypothetical protein